MDSSVESVADVPMAVPLDKVDSAIDITGSLIGVTKRTLDEMYDLYRKHGCLLGFSVRKSTSRWSNGVIYEKYFVCSCSGLKPCKKDNSLVQTKKRSSHITRTGCNATIRVKLNSSGLYEIVNHVLAHNHPFTVTERSPLPISRIDITTGKDKTSESLIAFDMRTSDPFQYMVHETGGEQSVDNTMEEHLNLLSHLKMAAIEGRDAETVSNMLDQQAKDEEDFFYRVKLDDQGNIQNLFWRDSVMKEDYTVYGDVVLFDTTCRTNKYNLIGALFVGINNHRKNVMFACAFLSDEKTDSFEWLFEVFKLSMLEKHPLTILTDQDLTVCSAIKKVFPSTRHRVCLWHLHQYAINKIGELKSDSSFKEAFAKCLTGSLNEDEFECCWNDMISTYGLENHPWFKRLYELREKWCTTLSKDIFSARILSSQRGESANFVVRFNTSRYTSLTDFYRIVKETLKRWRNNEEHDEIELSRSCSSSVLPMVGLLKHASEVYTPTIFKDFEGEFMRCISARSSVESIGNMLVYSVTNDKGCTHRVEFDVTNDLINCSCNKLEEFGLFCCHCLRVFHINSVDKIPQHYIAKRWTRFSKNGVWDTLHRVRTKDTNNSEDVIWRHEMIRKYYNLLLKCQSSKEARKILEDGYSRDSMAISNLASSPDVVVQCDSDIVSSSLNTALDATHSVTKRRRQ